LADPPHSSGRHELRAINGSATHSTLTFWNRYCAPFRDSVPIRSAAVVRRRTRSQPAVQCRRAHTQSNGAGWYHGKRTRKRRGVPKCGVLGRCVRKRSHPRFSTCLNVPSSPTEIRCPWEPTLLNEQRFGDYYEHMPAKASRAAESLHGCPPIGGLRHHSNRHVAGFRVSSR